MARVFLVCGLALALGRAEGAQFSGDARVLSVEVRCGPAGDAAGAAGPGGRYMRKFVEELAEPAAVINVRWRTPAKGQPPGTIVRLDVRRTGASGAQSFEIAYPGRLAGRVSTNFRVPRLPDEGADGIASWRVQVIHTGRVLAEQASASWK